MWTTVESPVGTIRLVARENAVTAVEFVDAPAPPAGSARSSLEAAAARSDRRPVGERDDDAPLLREAAAQLGAYFDRELREFDLPLRPSGTPFQLRVWQELRRIGYGDTCSYGDVARRMGMTVASSRAVGLANGRNPIAIVVPCHRVVGSGGALTGYAGGIERKQTLLELEQHALF